LIQIKEDQSTDLRPMVRMLFVPLNATVWAAHFYPPTRFIGGAPCRFLAERPGKWTQADCVDQQR
jgi:hypothetical protein